MATSVATGAVDHTAPIASTAVYSAIVRVVPVVLSIGAGAVLAGHIPETIFLALAVVVGLPHGAFDHKVARRAFEPRYGARWWQPFLIGYAALASAMLLAWWTIPATALSLFLLLSIMHFGDEDAPVGAPVRLLRIVAHGGAPIIVSAACHPQVVERLFAALVPANAHAATVLLGGPLTMLWVAAAGGSLIAYAARGQADDWAAALDLILVALLFAHVSPLIAFSLYFAAIHAPRAFAAALPKGGISARETVLPLVLTVLGLTLGAVIFVAGTRMTVGDNVVRTAFLLLSTLTVPHMWLERCARLASVSAPAVRTTA